MLNRVGEACALSILALALAAGCSKTESPGQGTVPAAPAPETAAAPAAPAAGLGGEALFGQKCTVCHDRTMATTRKETRESWAGIVKDMQAKREGWISDEDAAKIVDFLAEAHGMK